MKLNGVIFIPDQGIRYGSKGEESGNFHDVVRILVDCDFDSLLVKVNVKSGISCHTGRNSCFYNEITDNGDTINIIEEVLKDPKLIYKK